MLDIAAPVLGRIDTVHPALLWDNQSALLVDTGFPRQIGQLREAVEKAGLPFDKISRVVITHQDIDHIGNLPELANELAPALQVLAHEAEKLYIQGERRLLKFSDEAIASIDRLPPEIPEQFKLGLKALMLNPPSAPVDRTVRGGERLPWYGGIVVIDTPGHSPGHISLYHEPTKTLIAGDALTVVDGNLCGPSPETTPNLEQALLSLQQLASFDIDTVICYHGGLYRGDIRARILEIACKASPHQ
ncbi:MBL fold metallo-hydrolase [Cohnella faecalis]|uniref:MBL fold metallo-hydrolase n=2 Tax=Cohnella faecalis TaxID=2315694 RepID=A0A398CPN4_9BACL|nr:MBL fold metallo-hydrolase [Cohnella faecalis]